MTVMEGDDLQRLWSLIEDLTNQLQANRQLCESLQQQADQLRGQAIHTGTGFALRRFNTDLSKEKFESELEALNAHLVKENLSLSHENKQQAVLLREYENTLETIMAKFRSFSHSTQQHTLRLTQHYETLLANTTQNAAEQTLATETAFSGTLTHLGGLVRMAMRSIDGEESDEESDADEAHAGQSTKKRGWTLDPKWYGSGGYTGKDTDPASLRAEQALEKLTEEERLRIENQTLRELLELKERSDALAHNSASVAPPPALATAEVEPASPEKRRASLTVDQAAIAAEASGQPSLKALEISSTQRPGEEPLASPRSSPKTSPVLDRKEQIIEEAILAEDEDISARGRRSSDSNGIADAIAAVSQLRSEDSSSSSGSLLSNGPVHAQAVDDSEDADAIQPISEPSNDAGDPAGIGLNASTESAIETFEGPNLVAEAAPPALISTGIEEGEMSNSNTSVTSVSGSESHEVSDSTAGASATTSAEPTQAEMAKSNDTVPSQTVEGDFQPIQPGESTVPQPQPQPQASSDGTADSAKTTTSSTVGGAVDSTDAARSATDTTSTPPATSAKDAEGHSSK